MHYRATNTAKLKFKEFKYKVQPELSDCYNPSVNWENAKYYCHPEPVEG